MAVELAPPSVTPLVAADIEPGKGDGRLLLLFVRGVPPRIRFKRMPFGPYILVTFLTSVYLLLDRAPRTTGIPHREQPGRTPHGAGDTL